MEAMLVHLCKATYLLFHKLSKFQTSKLMNDKIQHPKHMLSRLTGAMIKFGNVQPENKEHESNGLGHNVLLGDDTCPTN
eukprot:808545-Ditylum_brightwellii.AAC.1